MFGRKVRVIITSSGKARQFDNLQVEFEIKRTASKRPSPGKIQIYNLSEDSFNFAKTEDAQISLFAGYENLVSNIFFGDIDNIKKKANGLDIVSEITARDGGKAYSDGLISKTFTKASAKKVFESIADEMGLPISFYDERIVYEFSDYTMFGKPREYMDEVCQIVSASWSIQSGSIVISKIGEKINKRVVLLSPESGLIGSPEKEKKVVKVKSQLNGLLEPKSIVKLQSKEFDSFYEIKEATHKGSLYGSEFSTELTLKEV